MFGSIAFAQEAGVDRRPRTASVSGRVTVDGKPSANIAVTVTETHSGSREARIFTLEGREVVDRQSYQVLTDAEGKYRIAGLPPGEYQVSPKALTLVPVDPAHGQEQIIKITLDEGEARERVDFALERGGVITGRVIPDADKDGRPAAGCTDGARLRLEEIRLDARSNSAKRNPEDRFFLDYEYWGSWRGSMANQKGEFAIYNLIPGSYRLNVNLPGDELYVRSLARRETGAGGRSADISRASIAIKPGEKIGGIEVNIGAGAVRVRGRVLQAADTPSAGGPRQSPRLLIHLIPAEEAAAGDLLRYGETLAGRDGSFEFRHLAPGKYWLLARPAPEADAVDKQSRPLAWDEAERARLRRQAAASSAPIDLKPCQRLDDYILKVDPK